MATIRPLRGARITLSAMAALSVVGCSSMAGNDYPDDMQGMPAATYSEMDGMFSINDHPDGSPTRVIRGGEDVGRWVPAENAGNGCIGYVIALDEDKKEKYLAPETIFYWHGDQFRTEKEGCKTIGDIVHDNEGDWLDRESSSGDQRMPSARPAGGGEDSGLSGMPEPGELPNLEGELEGRPFGMRSPRR